MARINTRLSSLCNLPGDTNWLILSLTSIHRQLKGILFAVITMSQPFSPDRVHHQSYSDIQKGYKDVGLLIQCKSEGAFVKIVNLNPYQRINT